MVTKAHIAIVSPCMGDYGGLEAFVLEIANGVVDENSVTIEVVFKKAVTPPQENLLRKIRESNAKVIFCDRLSLRLLRSILRADLVHLQNPCPDVVFISLLCFKPILLNIINYRRSAFSLHNLLWNISLKLASQRFYISDFVRRSWERTSIPSKNSKVVFPICKLPNVMPLPPEQRTGFVFVARWIENKGLDTLLKAYSLAGLDSPGYPLRLLGDGPLRLSINSLISSLGLKNVYAPGFLPDEEKVHQIRKSRFAVIPPNTSEDFGLVAIEARNLGLPCLITNDGGLPEAAGPYCLACQPGNVEDLARILLEAVKMSDAEYIELADKAHNTLYPSLVQPEFYAKTYLSMLGKSNLPALSKGTKNTSGSIRS